MRSNYFKIIVFSCVLSITRFLVESGFCGTEFEKDRLTDLIMNSDFIIQGFLNLPKRDSNNKFYSTWEVDPIILLNNGNKNPEILFWSNEMLQKGIPEWPTYEFQLVFGKYDPITSKAIIFEHTEKKINVDIKKFINIVLKSSGVKHPSNPTISGPSEDLPSLLDFPKFNLNDDEPNSYSILPPNHPSNDPYTPKSYHGSSPNTPTLPSNPKYINNVNKFDSSNQDSPNSLLDEMFDKYVFGSGNKYRFNTDANIPNTINGINKPEVRPINDGNYGNNKYEELNLLDALD